jgi:hypothetical protein
MKVYFVPWRDATQAKGMGLVAQESQQPSHLLMARRVRLVGPINALPVEDHGTHDTQHDMQHDTHDTRGTHDTHDTRG